jgi:hypothetical protein
MSNASHLPVGTRSMRRRFLQLRAVCFASRRQMVTASHAFSCTACGHAAPCGLTALRHIVREHRDDILAAMTPASLAKLVAHATADDDSERDRVGSNEPIRPHHHLIIVEHLNEHDLFALVVLLSRLLNPGCSCGDNAVLPGRTLVLAYTWMHHAASSQRQLCGAFRITNDSHTTTATDWSGWFDERVAVATNARADAFGGDGCPALRAALGVRDSRRHHRVCPWVADRAVPTSAGLNSSTVADHIASPPRLDPVLRSVDVAVLPTFGKTEVENTSYNITDLLSRVMQHRRHLVAQRLHMSSDHTLAVGGFDGRPSPLEISLPPVIDWHQVRAAGLIPPLTVSVVSSHVGLSHSLRALYGREPLATVRHVLIK